MLDPDIPHLLNSSFLKVLPVRLERKKERKKAAYLPYEPQVSHGFVLFYTNMTNPHRLFQSIHKIRTSRSLPRKQSRILPRLVRSGHVT